MAINGHLLAGLHHGQVVDIIKKSEQILVLQIEKQKPLKLRQRLSTVVNHQRQQQQRLSTTLLNQSNGSLYQKHLVTPHRGSLILSPTQHLQSQDNLMTRSVYAATPTYYITELAPVTNLYRPRIVTDALMTSSMYTETTQANAPAQMLNAEDVYCGIAVKEETEGEKEEILEVELKRAATGFGFSIHGGTSATKLPIFILRVAADSPASEQLQAGDEILAINGQNTDNVLHSDAVELIKSSPEKLQLRIKRDPNNRRQLNL
ncbi:hypothetical protein Ciccas_005280 [Cichlidogyrus casuarinus]|uniref:PDZ domain-containing protein n=1 Tax=Cichlidogyrus casuarinus TaxID=1844966 RepID=A0ABD2Q935_9PLAT